MEEKIKESSYLNISMLSYYYVTTSTSYTLLMIGMLSSHFITLIFVLQLLLDVLHFFAASFSALTHSYTLEEKVVLDVLGNSILVHLDLIQCLLENIEVLISHFCL